MGLEEQAPVQAMEEEQAPVQGMEQVEEREEEWELIMQLLVRAMEQGVKEKEGMEELLAE